MAREFKLTQADAGIASSANKICPTAEVWAGRAAILGFMRSFSLFFALISIVMLAMFLIYVIRGPVDPLIAAGLFVSFSACLVPALLLLKPFESREDFRRRREKREQARRERRDHRSPGDS